MRREATLLEIQLRCFGNPVPNRSGDGEVSEDRMRQQIALVLAAFAIAIFPISEGAAATIPRAHSVLQGDGRQITHNGPMQFSWNGGA